MSYPYYDTGAEICVEGVVYDSYFGVWALTFPFSDANPHSSTEAADEFFVPSMQGYLTEVSFDAQRALASLGNPHLIPAHQLTVDQLILRSLAAELERRK